MSLTVLQIPENDQTVLALLPASGRPGTLSGNRSVAGNGQNQSCDTRTVANQVLAKPVNTREKASRRVTTHVLDHH